MINMANDTVHLEFTKKHISDRHRINKTSTWGRSSESRPRDVTCTDFVQKRPRLRVRCQERSEPNVCATEVPVAAAGSDGHRRHSQEPQSKSRTRRQISSVKSEHFALPPKSFVKLWEKEKAKINALTR